MANNYSFQTPSKLNVCNVNDFLIKATSVFKMVGMRAPNAVIDCSKTVKIDFLGLLLLYKYLEFCSIGKCFRDSKCIFPTFFKKELKEKGFTKFFGQLAVNKDEFNQETHHFDYESLKFIEYDKLFIAPIALSKTGEKDGVNNIAPKIENYYKESPIKCFFVTTIIAEIASNFRNHAVEDTQSILTGVGSKEYFEMACADTGLGIITTLKPYFSYSAKKYSQREILNMAIRKGVTSKSSETGHMGYGLWMISELIKAMKGEMKIISENATLFIHNGNMRLLDSPYWKGTIVYIKLPLVNTTKLINALQSIKPTL